MRKSKMEETLGSKTLADRRVSRRKRLLGERDSQIEDMPPWNGVA
jgi:hypothetical protein